MKVKEFLTPERRREIESEISDLEKRIKGDDSNDVGYMEHAINRISSPKEIQLEIAKRKKQIEDGTPKPFKTTAQANKAYAWAKKAEKWIKDHHPNDAFVAYPKPGNQEHDFDRSVKRMTEWLKSGSKYVEQYRYVMRRLDPNNPDAGKIKGL